MTNSFTRPVPVRTLVESALAILVEYRKFIEQPPGSTVVIQARAVRTVEAKLRAALDQLDNRGE